MSQTKAQLISDLVQALNFTGTASAPANGVFLSATNTLAFATNSGSRVTIDSNGKATFNVDGVFNSINIGKGANSITACTVLGENALDAANSGSRIILRLVLMHLTDNTSGGGNTAVGFTALGITLLAHQTRQLGSLVTNTTGVLVMLPMVYNLCIQIQLEDSKLGRTDNALGLQQHSKLIIRCRYTML